MGQERSFRKRKDTSFCIKGKSFTSALSSKPCQCTEKDFSWSAHVFCVSMTQIFYCHIDSEVFAISCVCEVTTVLSDHPSRASVALLTSGTTPTLLQKNVTWDRLTSPARGLYTLVPRPLPPPPLENAVTQSLKPRIQIILRRHSIENL